MQINAQKEQALTQLRDAKKKLKQLEKKENDTHEKAEQEKQKEVAFCDRVISNLNGSLTAWDEVIWALKVEWDREQAEIARLERSWPIFRSQLV